MKIWKEKGVGKESVWPLRSKHVAACLAAYVLNYESDQGETFLKMKERSDRNMRIYGEPLVEADESEKKTFLGILVNALADVTSEEAMGQLKCESKSFFD